MTKPVPYKLPHAHRLTSADMDTFDKLAIKVRLRCLTKDEALWLWSTVHIMTTFNSEQVFHYITGMLADD